ncbi:DNA-formamidopyrimidine glycosylase [Sporocytophaga myxococcoides]|uniref:DNA-formamidopyrimidine glycosylase n=1 Tax=Sporocytophaga myxococcoides TaxID=153721 RepID=A0A098LLS5_9BACT|nr:DNA-formamidopyrimidine glycosylase family protein [Sporocytophaga myxococcoides]GAL87449.1 DNA-formamidopyrimidine glycosylase [Sporocytophaga myxococcoides]
MPELPDVSVFKDYFDKTTFKKKIKRVEVFEKRIIKGTSEKELNNVLKGKFFKKSGRYGKHLFAEIDSEAGLDIHFGMTGDLELIDDLSKIPPFTRLLFIFQDGEGLAFEDQRIFGHISLVHNFDDLISRYRLGKDALEITAEEFQETIHKRKGKIKSLLMNQSLISGLGNVYADEILFQAGIHPESKGSRIPEEKIKKLFSTMNKVLKTAIKYAAKREDFPSKFLINHRKKNEDCPDKCGKIDIIKINGRTTYFCGACQELF